MANEYWFRESLEALWSASGPERVFETVLVPRIPAARAALDDMRVYGMLAAKDKRVDDDEFSGRPDPLADSWNLWAFTRLADHLICRLETVWSSSSYACTVSRAEFARFLEDIGLERVHCNAFHPFYHEIVEVDVDADPDAPPTIADELWPAFMLGSLLLVRSGVRITAGQNHVEKTVAETSTLYFTNVRPTRPVADLSHGWGHNSQWRTRARRDYVDGEHYYYNVDGKHPLSLSNPNEALFDADHDLELTERVELLRHRCFVSCTKPHDERWPYDSSLVEPRSSSFSR